MAKNQISRIKPAAPKDRMVDDEGLSSELSTILIVAPQVVVMGVRNKKITQIKLVLLKKGVCHLPRWTAACPSWWQLQKGSFIAIVQYKRTTTAGSEAPQKVYSRAEMRFAFRFYSHLGPLGR